MKREEMEATHHLGRVIDSAPWGLLPIREPACVSTSSGHQERDRDHAQGRIVVVLLRFRHGRLSRELSARSADSCESRRYGRWCQPARMLRLAVGSPECPFSLRVYVGRPFPVCQPQSWARGRSPTSRAPRSRPWPRDNSRCGSLQQKRSTPGRLTGLWVGSLAEMVRGGPTRPQERLPTPRTSYLSSSWKTTLGGGVGPRRGRGAAEVSRARRRLRAKIVGARGRVW
jgi:hypothetical protein